MSLRSKHLTYSLFTITYYLLKIDFNIQQMNIEIRFQPESHLENWTKKCKTNERNRESYDDRLEKSYDLIKIRVIKLIS